MASFSFTAKKSVGLNNLSSGVLVLPVLQDDSMTGLAVDVDEQAQGAIGKALALKDMEGKPGQHQWLLGSGKIDRILLIGVGKMADRDGDADTTIAKTLATQLAACKAKEAVLLASELDPVIGDLSPWLENLARDLLMATYRYTATLSKPKPKPTMAKLAVVTGESLSVSVAKKALAAAGAIGSSANITRELVNLPGNVCTPDYLAKQSRALGRKHDKMSVSVLDEKKMAELGMGSLLSVGNGSDEPSKLIVMNYKGGKAKDAPYCIVGKGITFDTSGISLKPSKGMESMKFDMGGAGSVVGTMNAVAELKLPINVIGVIAAAENMPSGRATKPGDVVTSMSGKTIEILNTDAEGRLVLCDALTYGERYKPASVIDVATLTGAAVATFGSHVSALLSNDDALAEELIDCGNASLDQVWQLPLHDEYQHLLDSNFADIANIGGPRAGTITAACFLSRFTKKFKWAHLDIAGSAWNSGAAKGATGRPVSLLLEYLRRKAD
ncbi:MAG TPA: leucyl aminopeptidase [Gammaproteobacteria bacterium]|nr:leucyl aminopeptidase [Gammaproteobacteria bacterium]